MKAARSVQFSAWSDTPEPTSFGIQKELHYTGLHSQASNLVPLGRKLFASSDDTHIHIWGQEGDVAKLAFPSGRRSMVLAMAVCPNLSVLITAEVDMTLKAYTLEGLEIVETFVLERLRQEAKLERSEKEKKLGIGKAVTMEYLSPQQWVLMGGEGGLEVWRLAKSSKLRAVSLRGLEHQLNFELQCQLFSDPVDHIFVHSSEGRVITSGSEMLRVFDLDLVLLSLCRVPNTDMICSSSIHVLNAVHNTMLTGSFEGTVSLWNIQVRHGYEKPPSNISINNMNAAPPVPQTAPASLLESQMLPASMRLDHRFLGHSRAVEMVCFYYKREREVRQTLCVSVSRDGKMKVWSIEHLTIVYTLEVPHIDSKTKIFPFAPHYFAVATAGGSAETSSRDAEGATVTLLRFTMHIASPLATTSQGEVIEISQPPELLQLSSPGLTDGVLAHRLQDAAVLKTRDMAVRIVSSRTGDLLSTLPPPPNSQVQVLQCFLCPVWQLMVLWLSSQEVAVFFVPIATDKEPKMRDTPKQQSRSSETPLLLRRFSILDVRTVFLDKDLSLEHFECAALHWGPPPPWHDSMHLGTEVGSQSSEPDWFLMIGTKKGTVQAFKLATLLDELPVWKRLSAALPPGSWKSPQEDLLHVSEVVQFRRPSGKVDERLQAIEKEHLLAMESSRVPGQRPFPSAASPLRLHGRWKHHDYEVISIKSVGDKLLTTDAMQILRIFEISKMVCLMRFGLQEFTCQTVFLRQPPPESQSLRPPRSRSERRGAFCMDLPSSRGSKRPDDLDVDPPDAESCPLEEWTLGGVVAGTTAGVLRLFQIPNKLKGQPTITSPAMTSNQSHSGAVLQLDFTWPLNVFVSIGEDDTLKLWSARLVLLREISFPQRLTSVAFRRCGGSDDASREDVLLGFSAHVEQISVSFWARGISKMLLGESGAAPPLAEPERTRRGLARIEASDDIQDHVHWLHSEKPDEARRELEGRQGVNLLGAMFVRKFMKRMKEAGHDHDAREQARQEVVIKQEKLKKLGQVQDFRGPPAVEIETLSGPAADLSHIKDMERKQSEEPQNKHIRSSVLDWVDFGGLTRSLPISFDWTVDPSACVDAPRHHAIRGVARDDNVAIVTSKSIGHLRQSGTRGRRPETSMGVELPIVQDGGAEEALPVLSPSQSFVQPPTMREPLSPSSGRLSPLTNRSHTSKASEASPRRDSRPAMRSPPEVERQLSTAKGDARTPRARILPDEADPLPARTASKPQVQVEVPGQAAEDWTLETEKKAADTVDSDEEQPWRNERLARGIAGRRHEPPPLIQQIANSKDDIARKLLDRGILLDANLEALEETDLLKKLLANKADWLYCGAEHRETLERYKASLRHPGSRQKRASSLWTTAGRLVCAALQPPPQALPGYEPPLPSHLLRRPPMTRSEVTEQRLILSAMNQPLGPPGLVLESEEFWRLQRSGRFDLSQPGSRGSPGGRRPAPRSLRRSQPPLTAR